ncbi:MAG: pyrimidine reductase family protein [Actinomycetes bacterium]
MHRLLPEADTSADTSAPGDSRLDAGHDLDDTALAAAYAYPSTPWLRANMVATADGAASATGSGVTEGISSKADKRLFGVLRGLADVVLVGGNTVRREGYGPARPKKGWAEARQAEGRTPVPAIAVVSGRLDLDPASPLFTDAAVRTLVLTTASAPADRRAALAEVAEVVEAGDGHVDLPRAVAALHERGHQRMLCEGGPRLLAQICAAGLLDELCLTVSPLLAAGDSPRILRGAPIQPPLAMRLADVLTEDGTLFCRYERAG